MKCIWESLFHVKNARWKEDGDDTHHKTLQPDFPVFQEEIKSVIVFRPAGEVSHLLPCN